MLEKTTTYTIIAYQYVKNTCSNQYRTNKYYVVYMYKDYTCSIMSLLYLV